MKTEASKSFKQGFVLSEQEVRRLYDVLIQQIEKVIGDEEFETSFEIKFANGAIASPASLDEIVELENFGSAALRRLRIRVLGLGKYNEYQETIQFSFPDDTDDDTQPIKYTIVGEDRDWVFITSSLLDERIERIKSFTLSRSFWRNFPLVATQILLIVYMLMMPITNKTAEKLSTIENQWHGHQITDLGDLIIALERVRIEYLANPFRGWETLALIVLMVLFLVAMLFGEKLFQYLFPTYVFLWGDWIKEYEKRKSRRNFVFIVVALGIILSLLSNYLYDFLTGR